MINLATLTEALVSVLQAIPELVDMLGTADNIVPYIDVNPDKNSISSATYEMKPGTVMVTHVETVINTVETHSMWLHTMHILVRAARGQRNHDIVMWIVNGVPTGETIPWQYCPVMNGTERGQIVDILREQDSEGIDYHVIVVQIPETGDQFKWQQC